MIGPDVYNLTQIAYVNCQVACAMAEIEGMKAENMQRSIEGNSMAYVHDDFCRIIDKYGLDHNTVLTTLRAYWG